eukprot:TRINITY_DN4005_c0_g1_i1.p1 TRINITY_DN4005_c0_g1~~TRINITY_DN4005_c0_g1_i1.p1  ORF type:complete len:415 (-),score=97.02 TRINITY_DN4005_c0_g1_i1:138-1382(-)
MVRVIDTPREALIATGLSVALLVSGVANNVGGSMQSYVMPAFPIWLLYMTTIIYSTVFFFVAFYYENPFSKANRTWKRQKYYLLLGVNTAMNGVFFQFSAAWVDGLLSQILANLTILQVPILECVFMPERRKNYKDPRQIASLIIVFAGIAVGIYPAISHIITAHGSSSGGEQSDRWYWILMFVMSSTFSALQLFGQDVAYNDKKCFISKDESRSDVIEDPSVDPVGIPAINNADPIAPKTGIQGPVCLAWFNMYSIPVYFLLIPLQSIKYINGTNHSTTFEHSYVNQGNAFRCFFGHPTASDVALGNCQSEATLWPLVFLAGYINMVLIIAYMIRRYGVLLPTLVTATMQLGATFVFTIPAIVTKAHADAFSWFPVLGCIVIIVGIVIKHIKLPNFRNRKDSQEKEGLIQTAA